MSSALLQDLPAGVCATDAEGRVTFFNEALVALLGRRPEIGACWWETLPLAHPDGRPMRREESAPARALAEGAPVRVAATARRPDGRRVQLCSLAAPLRTGAGGPTGAVEVLFEVADRDDAARRAAQIDQARLAAIVASSDDAIISKTLEGTVTTWNAAATRIFGYEAEEMIGQSILRIIPPELLSQEEEILARLGRGEHVEHFDTLRVAKDGRRVFTSLTISPVRDGAGRVVGASTIARDVTERKRAEDMQRLLLGELNHRVKNTLAIIQAIARQSLRLEPSPSAFVASFTGRVQALARAHDILIRGEMQRAELAHLVREQVDLGARDPRVSWRGPKVVLDSRAALQLALVLHELATNARKHGALSIPTGRLTLDWSVAATGGEEHELVLEWRESGVPGRDAPTSQGFGTLLIERSLLANGGRSAIRHLPEGFACEIRLPLPGWTGDPGRPAAIAGGGAPGAPAPDARPLAGVRVLVVEDEPLIAMDIEERLLAAGGDVIGPAANPETARRLIAETSPDAALLDANLAGSRVDDLALELRRRRVPFAFATGFGRDSLPPEFPDAPLLAKPFGTEELVQMVRALLAGNETAGRL
jgi:PAS domain S-box-containing protein